MGYTNYWTPNKKKIATLKEFPKEMLEKMETVRKKFNECVMNKTIGAPLVGSVTLPDSIYVNGTSEGLEIDLKKDTRIQSRIGIDSWTFCKTCRDHYDVVVKCFLMLLKKYGIISSWDHDGTYHCAEYRRAFKFARMCGIDPRGLGASPNASET